MKKRKNAFTMLELVIVIVIFGIIATIGANIIAKMYENYIQARTITYLQAQSEITLEQIAKRLQYRVKSSAVAKNPSNTYFEPLEAADVNHTIIQWIGYSNEAMIGVRNAPTRTGWSGLIDLNSSLTNSTNKTLNTPGSSLDQAAAIIQALSDNVDLKTLGKEAALIFKEPPVDTLAASPIKPLPTHPSGFRHIGYGYDGGGNDRNYILKVSADNDTVFKINETPTPLSVIIYDHYYLAHSAYALVPDTTTAPNTALDFTLNLYYDYQPWLVGNTYDNRSAKVAILANHVNLFRLRQVGNTIHMKLCLNDANQTGMNLKMGKPIVACKEEVVL